jgi:hypothetical protein
MLVPYIARPDGIKRKLNLSFGSPAKFFLGPDTKKAPDGRFSTRQTLFRCTLSAGTIVAEARIPARHLADRCRCGARRASLKRGSDLFDERSRSSSVCAEAGLRRGNDVAESNRKRRLGDRERTDRPDQR